MGGLRVDRASGRGREKKGKRKKKGSGESGWGLCKSSEYTVCKVDEKQPHSVYISIAYMNVYEQPDVLEIWTQRGWRGCSKVCVEIKHNTHVGVCYKV